MTWRSVLASERRGGAVPLALGVELSRRQSAAEAHWSARRVVSVSAEQLARGGADLRLRARPLMPSTATGAWVQSGVGWEQLRRGDALFVPGHLQWFTELFGIARDVRVFAGYSQDSDWVSLDAVESALLWPHLERAAGLGIPLVAVRKQQSIALGDRATVTLNLGPLDRGALSVAARVQISDEPVSAASVRPIGHTGVFAFRTEGDHIAVTLAAAPLSDTARAVLAGGKAVTVPAADADEFLREVYPRLVQSENLTAEEGLALPIIAPTTIVLTVVFRPENRVEYTFDRAHADDALAREVATTWADATDLPFAESGAMAGVDAAEFGARILPALEEIERLRIEVTGVRRAYRELTGDPRITVTTMESPDPDWFDLGIVVAVDGRTIPFGALFAALARRKKKILLADGAYFSLAHPALDRLRDLIAEAGAMAEWEVTPRINRHQIDLWADFEDLADEAIPALNWRTLIEGLRDTTSVPVVPVPSAVRAELRPYQREGLSWLAFLWRHRLGGVLADDMGLGKTLQLLALIAHAREGGEQRPVLVVAPTSVLATWAAEAARFVPDLTVRVVDATSAKRGESVASVAGQADLVITSYTLVRLDAAEFTAVPWAFVVLDEAQFVKNPATKLHRVVRELTADAVFAATGTPLENSLTDLWALLSLTAPGLFASPRRFREEYVKPIEHGKVPDNEEGGPFRARRLERLRRRIRPLMLRRTKESVAPELPAKAEQELRIALTPAHRALYDRVLARERQKVLGLLDDLDRNRFIVFRSLTLLRLMSLAPALVDSAHADVGSSKLDALVERVVEAAAEGHRVLVFSQFTSFLRLAADRLSAAGINYAYLDGSTRRRGAVVEAFREGVDPAFLISLKAGGFGLTLTEADYVFVLDPWWNPATEAQAVDRTHRIGQTRSVLVYRLIAADTIEDKVLALQQRKSRLFQAVINDDELFSQDLTADDIRALLGG